MEPVASIDRLTVVGDLDGHFAKGGIPHGRGVHAALEVCRSYAEQQSPGKYPYGSAFVLSGGGHVSFAREDTGVPLCRVDLNPNKLDVDAPVRDVLRLLFDTRCTRFDVAVDYPDMRVGDWVPVGRSGKSFVVAARSGRVETRMIGARSSARQLVVYDKVADCRAKKEPVPWGFTGDVTRVEARQRLKPGEGGGVLAPDLLDDVRLLMRGAENWAMGVKDRALLEYVHRYPDSRGELSRYMREKLDMLATVQGGFHAELSPGSIYRKWLPVLRETYFATLGAGGGGEVLPVSAGGASVT